MSAKKPTGTPSQKNHTPDPIPEPVPESSLDKLANIWLRFERYGWDILGVGFVALALITLFSLTGLSQGSFGSPWGSFLKRWFGAGSFLIAGLLGYLGFYFLSRRWVNNLKIRLGQILALEGAAFALLILLSILGGISLERAEAGWDGGVVGWGLARLAADLIPLPFSTILVFLVFVIFVLVGTGLSRKLIVLFEQWLQTAGAEANPEEDEIDIVVEHPEIRGQKSLRELEGATPLPVVPSRRDENLPPLELLNQEEANGIDEERIHLVAKKIEQTLDEFGIPSKVVGYRVGPTVTQFAVEPGYIEKIGTDGKPFQQKVRVSQISTLSRDLALALAAERLRIEAPVPGRSYVGVEVPNTSTAMVCLRPLLASEPFMRLNSPLAIALGRDVSGLPVVADLARMPHVLVAGTTGSGKSVCLAAITTCLVMNNTPATLRIAMLDPKMVELVRFNGFPHLLGKVETDIERMLGILRWALVEMDQRYRLLEGANARDLDAFNRKQERKKQETLPRIVILIDELADLMMSAPDQTEHALVRLAQMARAVGIHLVVATQRPSTDVVTGLIKANFPARIAFTVASSVDSRVILDMNGAETLLGRGDMLFLSPEVGTPQRAQGVLLKDQEVDKVIDFWQKSPLTKPSQEAPWEALLQVEEGGDDLVEQAIELVKKTQRASASLLQRRLRIGFPRAARLLDELEEMGIVGPAQGGGKDREVLIDPDDEEEQEGQEFR